MSDLINCHKTSIKSHPNLQIAITWTNEDKCLYYVEIDRTIFRNLQIGFGRFCAFLDHR